MTFEENFKTTLLKVWENEYSDSFGVSRALNKSHIYLNIHLFLQDVNGIPIQLFSILELRMTI